jgi:peroxiredoxin
MLIPKSFFQSIQPTSESIMKHFFTFALVVVFFCSERPTLEAQSSIPAKAEDISPVLNGTALPKVELEKPNGSQVDLSGLIGPKGAVLIFYRGGWCPYCNKQLSQLRTIEAEIKKLGLPVLAISADQPSKLKKPKGMEDSWVQLLSDRKMMAAKALGIAFRVDDSLFKKYLGYGIDLEDSSGEKHHLLPVPSVFLVNSKKNIAFSFVHPNYKVRLSSELVLAAAKSMLKP